MRSRTPEAIASTSRWSPSRTVSSSATRAAVTRRPAPRSSSAVVGVGGAVIAPTYLRKGERYKKTNCTSLRQLAMRDRQPLGDACFVAQQGGQVPGAGGGAVKAVRGEPSGNVGGVPVQELRAARIADHVDDLGQVDHDKAPVVDEQVVRGHVAVRQAMGGERDQGLHELIPQPGQLAA